MKIKVNNWFVLIILALTMGISSCNQELPEIENTDGQESGVLVPDDLWAEIHKNLDPAVIYINDMNDLNNLLNMGAAKRAKELERMSWKKMNDADYESMIKTRAATVTEYTKYEYISYAIANSQFKAKFSSTMVNIINEDRLPEYRIDTKSTYICGWRYIEPFYNLAANEQPAPLESPKCALKPSTRTGYTVRGYESYINNSRQFLMTTNVLEIVCKDAGGPTIQLSIRYPIAPNYEFKYAILRM